MTTLAKSPEKMTVQQRKNLAIRLIRYFSTLHAELNRDADRFFAQVMEQHEASLRSRQAAPAPGPLSD